MENRERPSETTSEKKEKQPAKKKRKPKKRNWFFLWISKWAFILLCFVSSVILGLAVGYGVLGEGSIPEIFDLKMWKHIYQLAFGS